MGAEWPRVLLGAVVEYITVGHVGRMAHEYVDDGIPFLRSQNVTVGGIDPIDVRFISAEFHSRLVKSALRLGDVVVVRTGRPGVAAVIDAAFDGANCADLVIIRPGELVNPRFLAGFINSVAQGHVSAHLVGAVQQHFNVGAARTIELGLPSPGEQRAIADLLGALDDKIESSRRASDASRAALMFAAPTAGAEIPLDQTATFVNGGALTKFANSAGRPILRIKELRAGVSAETFRTDAHVKPSHEVTFGDLLFSWSGTLLTRRWSGEESVLNQHVFRVDPNGAYPRWLIEAWIEQHLDRFRRIAADKATTMGHIQRHHLSEAKVLDPGPEVLAELDARWSPVDRLRMGLVAEARTLTAIRDALLPKLVSGQIRVPLTHDEQEAVETVVAELGDESPSRE